VAAGPPRLGVFLGLSARPSGPSAPTDRAVTFPPADADRDEAAFAAIVERHGPMVLRVCRKELCEAPYESKRLSTLAVTRDSLSSTGSELG
jgi:hypothetical protein